MKRCILAIVVAILSSSVPGRGQSVPEPEQIAALDSLNGRFGRSLDVHWNSTSGTPDAIRFTIPRAFNSDPAISARMCLDVLRGVLAQRSLEDRLDVIETRVSDGLRHVRFDQRYKGITVRGGEYVVTVRTNGEVQALLGLFHKRIFVDTRPRILLTEALQIVQRNPPQGCQLLDTAFSKMLIIVPSSPTARLGWEVVIQNRQQTKSWCYLIDANTGQVAELEPMWRSVEPWGNFYLRHPYLDPSYTTDGITTDNSGYLQGYYANILNGSGPRTYQPDLQFTYLPTDPRFDEVNLFRHIERFRRDFWNYLGFYQVNQITAIAHSQEESPRAYYDKISKRLVFTDNLGWTNFNSPAKEDKLIFHEYNHLVVDYVANLYGGGSPDYETGAIHEGTADYFAATHTGRPLILEYFMPNGSHHDWRNAANPRIPNYTEYWNRGNDWWILVGWHEPHMGGEF
jgi:hypothetical protein